MPTPEARPGSRAGGSPVRPARPTSPRRLGPGVLALACLGLLWAIPARGQEAVTWTELVNAASSAGSLSKTGQTPAWDAGAVSTKALVSDGYLEFGLSASEHVMAGLSQGNGGEGYADIDFAIYGETGRVQIYESGLLRGNFDYFAASDRFRVSVESGVVVYRRNGVAFYTSAVSPQFPLLADTTLHTPGTYVQDALLSGSLVEVGVAAPAFGTPGGSYAAAQSVTVTVSTAGASIHYTLDGTEPTGSDPELASGSSVLVDHDLTLKARAFKAGLFASPITTALYQIGPGPATEAVTWVELVNAASSAGSLSKTGGTAAWDAGAVSTKALVSDGYLEFSLSASEHVMAGLSQGNGGEGYADIDFAIYGETGRVQIYESGLLRGNFDYFAASDRFRVSVESGLVVYRRNGVAFYTSAVAPQFPLLADTTLHTPGTYVQDAVLSGSLVEVGVAAPAFDVPGGAYAGAQSVTVTVATAGASIHYTLDGTDPGPGDPTLASGSSVLVAGSLILKARAFASLLYASPVTRAHYRIGESPLTEAVLWRELQNVSSSGPGQLSKSGGGSAWDAGAVSTLALFADGYAEFELPVDKHAMAGLSFGDGGASYPDLDFALYGEGWRIQVYESGLLRGSFDPFQAGDLFRVGVESGQVVYRKNGAAFYTSPSAPRFPLLLDTSLHTPGGAISGAVLSGALLDVEAEPPTFSPPGGTYASAQQVAIVSATPLATVRYTTDGSEPGLADPVLAQGATVTVETATTLRARAFADGYFASATAAASYSFELPTLLPPEISPAGGGFEAPQAVTLSASPGAAIRYTTDGGEPDEASPVYGAPFVLDLPATVKAKAFQAGFQPSATAAAAFSFQAAAPSFSPPGGSYPAPQQVALATATPGAEIHYTSDGTSPTAASPLYTSPVAVSATLTLKAKAFRAGWQESAESQASYTILSVRAVAGGNAHSVALLPDGSVWAWGGNGSGQVGDGSNVERRVPVPVSALSGVVAVAAGSDHTLALLSDGTLRAWGSNGSGRLGDGTTASRNAPVPVSGLSGVVAVAAGFQNSFALTADGKLWSWGSNDYGSLGPGRSGAQELPQEVTGIGAPAGVTVVSVAAGDDHALLALSNGEVRAWGRNNNGQLGNNSTTDSAAAVTVQDLSGPLGGVVAVSAGDFFSHALKADGTVWGFGGNDVGKLGDGTSTQRTRAVATLVGEAATRVSSGQGSGYAVTASGLLRSWGWNSNGQLGDGGTTNRPTPVTVVGPQGVVSADGGHTHGLAVTQDGVVWAFGNNGNGRLGDGTTVQRTLPVAISEPGFLWKAAVPVASPAGGSYQQPQTVTLTTATPGALIHYTTTGVDPTEADPGVASGGTVTVSQTLTLKARAFKAGHAPSPVAASVYTLTVATPALSVLGGTYFNDLSVTVSCATAGAAIHYTTSGAEPTEADPQVASGGTVLVSSALTLKAKAFRAGFAASGTAQATYTLKVAPPSLTPNGGSFSSAQTVQAATATLGASLRYTTTGAEPTSGDPLVPAGGVLVDRSLTLKVRGTRPGYAASDTASAGYLVAFGTVATPAFSPGGGVYGEAQSVALSSSTPGAAIHYTLDGSPPTSSAPVYGGPILVTGNALLKAIALRPGWNASAVASAAYDLGTETAPLLTPPAGFYAVAQAVTLSASPGASIHYTTDGSEPSLSSPSVVSGGTLQVGESLLLKAKAWPAEAGSPSQTVRAAYWITGQIAAGGDHDLALQSDGTVWAWAENGNGQIGDGTTSYRGTPFAVPGAGGSKAIAAGAAFSLALRSDGTVLAWGANGSGQLGQGDTTQRSSATAIPGLSAVVAVAAGASHALALRADGTVLSWGANASGQLGVGDTSARTSPTAVGGLGDVVAIAAGAAHSLALRADGSVWAWGGNLSGQLGDGTQNSRTSPAPIAGLAGIGVIAAGEGRSLAVETRGGGFGTLWAWGANASGQVGDGTAANALRPLAVHGGVSAVAAGYSHTLAVLLAGTAWGWGHGGNGELGDGGSGSRLTPGVVGLETGWLQVAGGRVQSMALDVRGRVWTWGSARKLGNNTQIDAIVPLPTLASNLTLAASSWAIGDADGDGLSNVLEALIGTDPLLADTNGDGLGDGLSAATGRDPANPDLDLDGLSNADERARGTDPLRADTDGDGVPDGQDAFPLDATKSQAVADPGDTSPPTITLQQPASAVPLP